MGSPSKARFCKDILNTMVLLPSWNPTTWTPNSNSSSVSGQLKNKVFTGRPVTITREFISERPFNTGATNFMDKSLTKLAYKVTYGGTSKYWTSIDLAAKPIVGVSWLKIKNFFHYSLSYYKIMKKSNKKINIVKLQLAELLVSFIPFFVIVAGYSLSRIAIETNKRDESANLSSK